MNTLKLVILLGFLIIYSGGSASAQTAIGTTDAAASAGLSSDVFGGSPASPGFGNTSSTSQKDAVAGLDTDTVLPSGTRYQTGFSVRPGSPAPPATGPVTSSVPGTNSVGTFGSGQTTITNPNNSISETSPGTTSISQGQTGETSATTPGTPGNGQTGVPGTLSGSTVWPLLFQEQNPSDHSGADKPLSPTPEIPSPLPLREPPL